MISEDVGAVIWKEWRDAAARFDHPLLWGAYLLVAGVPLIGLGWLYAEIGLDWTAAPFQDGLGLLWVLFPALLTMDTISDSFAGERERQTLETLLASRLPDESALFGKLAASVGLTWGLLGMSIVGAWIAYGLNSAGWQFYALPGLIALLILPGAASVCMALVTLRLTLYAETIREAQSRAMRVVMLSSFIFAGASLLPERWLNTLSLHSNSAAITAGMILIAISAGLWNINRRSFRRVWLLHREDRVNHAAR